MPKFLVSDYTFPAAAGDIIVSLDPQVLPIPNIPDLLWWLQADADRTIVTDGATYFRLLDAAGKLKTTMTAGVGYAEQASLAAFPAVSTAALRSGKPALQTSHAKTLPLGTLAAPFGDYTFVAVYAGGDYMLASDNSGSNPTFAIWRSREWAGTADASLFVTTNSIVVTHNAIGNQVVSSFSGNFRINRSFTSDGSGVLTTTAAHRIKAGQKVNVSGSLPAELTANTTYYARDVTATTFALATTSGGAAIAISAGGGTVKANDNEEFIVVVRYNATSGTVKIRVKQRDSAVDAENSTSLAAVPNVAGLTLRMNGATVASIAPEPSHSALSGMWSRFLTESEVDEVLTYLESSANYGAF